MNHCPSLSSWDVWFTFTECNAGQLCNSVGIISVGQKCRSRLHQNLSDYCDYLTHLIQYADYSLLLITVILKWTFPSHRPPFTSDSGHSFKLHFFCVCVSRCGTHRAALEAQRWTHAHARARSHMTHLIQTKALCQRRPFTFHPCQNAQTQSRLGAPHL